ncbi:MAG: DUF4870 domain-containing protein, partial [Brachybacterium sp.]|nr:DUF4870 domain-containing protein [Brachybacterium sp.]
GPQQGPPPQGAGGPHPGAGGPQQGAPHPGQGPGAAPGAGYGTGPGYGAGATGGETQWSDTPPPHVRGVAEQPLTGNRMDDSSARIWAVVANLAALLHFAVPFVGALAVQIIMWAVLKDRNRFVRFYTAEALNFTIVVVIAQIVLGILATIFTVLTLGIGAFAFGILALPPIVQGILAIIGAIKAWDRTWWNYPWNLRMVR